MALLFAFSIQDQVEKYGAYVGLAAFLGLAVLTVLYFAQARELKRLRDWAGRAPERAQEIEARVVAQADELRRADADVPEPVVERSGTVSPAQPIAKPVAAPSGNGRGTGTPAPIPPGPRPAVAVAAAAAQTQAAVATPGAPAESDEADAETPESSETTASPEAGASPETSAASEATASPAATGDGSPPAATPSLAGPPTELHPAPDAEDTGDGDEVAARDEDSAPDEDEVPEPDEAPGSGGNGVATPPPAIPRATPRPQPRPAPAAALRSSTSRSTTVPPRRGTAAPARRDSGGRSRAGRITLITLGGIVGLAVVIFGAMQILGGDGGEKQKPPANVAEQPNATPGGGGGNPAVDVADQRPDTVVVVLNGTATDGLAGSLGDKLKAEGYSDEPGMIRTGNNTDQQRQDSLVLYAPGQRRMARDIAQILGITSRPEAIDDDTLALANNTGDSAAGHETDVVVVAGADQAS
jgi:LytR cell envelope-related transcriptional attenuator